MKKNIHYARAEAEREAAENANSIEAAYAHRELADLHLSLALEADALGAAEDLSRPTSLFQFNLCDGGGLDVETRFSCGGKFEGAFQMTDLNRDVATDETERLIASTKVEGTSVYSRDGEKLGSIYNFMVDKQSGRVEYAVLQFGGLFGLGSDYYPLPWAKLSYDVAQDGYVTDVDRALLDDAPSFGDTEPRFDRAYDAQVHGYYGVPLL